MDWSKINDKVFEKIACAYAADNYKEYDWIPTGQSWDGNKDAAFRAEIQALNYYYKGWCEAKYTQDSDSSIPKSHMDSTLVSGILDGEVIFILFVTNGKITEDFMKRATAILKPHKIRVSFVGGDILTNWLEEKAPELINEYWDNIDIRINKLELKIEIKDACFLPAILSSPSLNSPLKKLKIKEEYFLYLNIYSNQQLTISIELNTRALVSIPVERPEYKLMPGNNLYLVRCITKQSYNGHLQISLFSEGEIILQKNILNLLIQEDNSPCIVYSQQHIIYQQVYECVKTDIQQNCILHITGYEGSGKSFLLRQLVTAIATDYNEVLNISFSEKEAENASSLCKLILFINFGYLYDLSEEAFKKLIAEYTNFPLELFLELKEGSQNQITALNTIDKIIKLLADADFALFPNMNNMVHRNITYIIIDDFQKISLKYSDICKEILDEFVLRSFDQILIICNRPKEFDDLDLEENIQRNATASWNLKNISIADVFSSIEKNFNTEVAKISTLFPPPISVLHLELLIKKLKEKNILHFPREKRGISFAEVYNDTNIKNNQFAVNKIKNCSYLRILYIVYKIESGVPVSLLQSFFGDFFDSVSMNFDKDTLIKEENELLKPYHDIYVYAFAKMNFDNQYMNELNRFLEFCIAQNVDNPILFSNILSILIAKDNGLRNNYLKLARDICADYYSKSQYIAAQNLAFMLLPDFDTTPYIEYKYEDLELLYIYAQVEKYSKTHVGSSRYLQMIADIGGKISLTSWQRGIVYEAHSELITNYIYSLDFDNFRKELTYYEAHLKDKTNIDSSPHKINAYLNFLNRSILYFSFVDEENAWNAYKRAYSESKTLARDDYQAYADMDYGKVIIDQDIKQAIEYFYKALPIFQKLKQCKKREIDCNAEIVFAEFIKDNKTYDALYDLQKKALENRYIHVYAKITLMLLTLELYNGESTENIEAKLVKLQIDYPDLKNANRLTLFVYQLFTAIYYIKGDYQQQQRFAKQHQNLAATLSENYVLVPKHNLQQFDSKSIVWFRRNQTMDSHSLWLDPRIW